ncbi:MAG: c-type cytochrome [Mongoliitalea sp.]
MKVLKSLSIGLMAIATLSFACSGGGSSSETASSTPAAPVKVSLEDKYKDDPIFIEGSAKAKQAGCTACHMIERKIVGPSYADVAEKYENTPENIAMLTAHVINGNVGNWGEIQMPAHPHLAKEEVETIIKYVLLLKR